MTPIFKTPHRYKCVAAMVMAINIAKIITFTSYLGYWMDNDLTVQGTFVCVVHMMVIMTMTMVAGHLTAEGMKFERFIRLMEGNGFVYYPEQKEFRPGPKGRE